MSAGEAANKIPALFEELAKASQRLAVAQEAKRKADSEESSALNAYNEVTKKIDAAYAAAKREAPYRSDWNSPHTERA
jgi:hypothetical protein